VNLIRPSKVRTAEMKPGTISSPDTVIKYTMSPKRFYSNNRLTPTPQTG